MTLIELKHAVDSLLARGKDENSPVLITTSEPSIGGRASVGVSYITPGIDWEQGQIRITPEKPLVKGKES
jgi:hypothetical protein